MRQISLNNYDLDTDNNITVTVVEHDQIPIQELSIQELARRDRALIVGSQFTPKKIRIEGRITGDNIDDLEEKIDIFKTSISSSNMAFQIQYASGTRTYYVELASLTISRQSYHVNYVPFTMELVAADPAGYGSSYSRPWTNIYTSVYDCTLTAEGSWYPEPVITISVVAETNVGQIKFRNDTTGTECKIDMDFSAGDEIIISCITSAITVNGNQVNFSGAIPKFEDGVNRLTATFTGDARDVDMTINYQAKYL